MDEVKTFRHWGKTSAFRSPFRFDWDIEIKLESSRPIDSCLTLEQYFKDQIRRYNLYRYGYFIRSDIRNNNLSEINTREKGIRRGILIKIPRNWSREVKQEYHLLSSDQDILGYPNKKFMLKNYNPDLIETLNS